jgi:hypothetical protein
MLLRVAKIGIVLGGLVVLGLGALPFGQDLVVAAGRYIPSRDLLSDYEYALLWATALGVSIFAWPVGAAEKRALLWVWAAKCEVALGLMLFYEWTYGLDAYSYFFFGQPGVYVDQPLVFGQGTEIMYWLSHLHWEYLVPSSYHAMKVSFSYLGLAGVYFFARAAMLAVPGRDARVVFFIGLFPSTLQWSSILGKDPISFAGVGLYSYGVVCAHAGRRGRGFLCAALGMFIAASTRPWLLLILLGSLFPFVLGAVRGFGAKVALASLGVAAFVSALFLLSDRLQISSMDDIVQRTERISQSFAAGGSANESELASENSPAKMLAFAPVGAFSALFRPLPGEVPNVFGMLASLENAVLLFWAVRAFRRSRLRELREPLVAWAMVLVLVWSVVYGFVSFHNLGTGARFRLQVIALFSCLLWHLGRRRG